MTVATVLHVVDDQGRTHFIRGKPVEIPSGFFREAWIESADKAVKEKIEHVEGLKVHLRD